jgi:hypothetical protein
MLSRSSGSILSSYPLQLVSRHMSCVDSKRLLRRDESNSRMRGMTSSAPEVDPRAIEVDVSEDELTVVLADGRRIAVPLAWFPRLLSATPEERSKFEILGGGVGIHWPKIDEDLSVEGLLRGIRAPGNSPRAV